MTDLFLYIGGIVFILDMIYISIKNKDKSLGDDLPKITHPIQLVYWVFNKFSTWISIFELVWIIYGFMSPFKFYFSLILLLNVLQMVSTIKHSFIDGPAAKYLFWINNAVKIIIVLAILYMNYTQF